MSPSTRETLFRVLLMREIVLAQRITAWSMRGARMSRAEKDKLIDQARGEWERIAAARAELKLFNVETTT